MASKGTSVIGNEGHVQAHDLARNLKGVVRGFRHLCPCSPPGEEEAG